MKRRRLLATVTTASVAFSGCLTGDSDDSPPVGLGAVTMTNVRDESIDARFAIEKDGETVYDRSHRLSGADDGRAGSVEIVEDWMGEKVDYTVTVSIIDTGQERSFSTADAEDFVSDWGEKDCFLLSVTPDRSELYFALGAMESCPESATHG